MSVPRTYSPSSVAPATRTIRVLLVDDHAVVRLGLRTLLSASPDIEVVGEASDGAEAIRRVEQLDPDVVLMDLSMTGMDGTAATRELKRLGTRARVLVLTMHDEADYLVPLLEAGAQGYVLKSSASTELLDAVRIVASGRTFVRPAAAAVLAQAIGRKAAPDELEVKYGALSDRERTVFRLTVLGHATSQIGTQLSISSKTVDTYRRRIADKLGVNDRAEWVRLALRLGLLTEDAAG